MSQKKDATTRSVATAKTTSCCRLASFLLVATITLSTLANAQTSDPYLNDVLRDTDRLIGEGYRLMREVEQKDRRLRTACWQGNKAACQELKDFLVDPNMNPNGERIDPP